MANPNFYKGMRAINPAGRPKDSVLTVRGMLLRFIQGALKPTVLKKLYNTLKEKEKLDFLVAVLPYLVSRQQADSLSDEEINELYSKLEMKIKNEMGKAS